MRTSAISAGDRFGRLVVKRRGVTERIGRRYRSVWICDCDCGNEHAVKGDGLRSGKTQSCGCLYRQNVKRVNVTHGHARNRAVTPELLAWRSMMTRCTDRGYINFDRYGGRGINVCDRWLGSFENFLADMGTRPSRHHSLDRYPNRDGNYEPGNCRWATQKEQARNKDSTIIVEFEGKQVPLVSLAEMAPVSYWALKWRIKRGWDIHKALTTPKRSSEGVLK